MGEAEDLIRELRDALKPFAALPQLAPMGGDYVSSHMISSENIRLAREALARADAALNSGG